MRDALEAAYRLLGEFGVREVATYERRRLVGTPLGTWPDNA